MKASELHELGEMATTLLGFAIKLPPEPERFALLKEIGRFRAKITSLESSALARQSTLAGSAAKK